jgi:hypothetical protein
VLSGAHENGFSRTLLVHTIRIRCVTGVSGDVLLEATAFATDATELEVTRG